MSMDLTGTEAFEKVLEMMVEARNDLAELKNSHSGYTDLVREKDRLLLERANEIALLKVTNREFEAAGSKLLQAAGNLSSIMAISMVGSIPSVDIRPDDTEKLIAALNNLRAAIKGGDEVFDPIPF